MARATSGVGTGGSGGQGPGRAAVAMGGTASIDAGILRDGGPAPARDWPIADEPNRSPEDSVPRLEPDDVVFLTSPEELRAWLLANHETAAECWVGFRPKASGLPTITWHELVDEVLCVGWIDGVRMKVDGGSCIRITPRRGGSIWSARNVGRVEALRAEGRMLPAGEAAFARRRADRTAVYSFERQPAAFSPEAEAAFRADRAAWSFWEAQPPGYRRTATDWVTSAKRPETQARRLAKLMHHCADGERVPELGGRAPASRATGSDETPDRA